ncbi:MAG: hypothetical protein V3V10_10315 [Planctomycetota bacterium]
MTEERHLPSIADQEAGIKRFWDYWAKNSAALAKAIHTVGDTKWQEIVTKLVKGICESMAWEMGRGLESQHHFCLSSEGDIELRIIAERWLQSKLPKNEFWEFHTARQGQYSHGQGIQMGEGEDEFEFDDFRIQIELDEHTARGHLKVFHPLFENMRDENDRVRITFIVLDNVIGEDDVENWVGAVETSQLPIPNGIGLGDLREALLPIMGQEDVWSQLESKGPEGVVFVVANLSLKRLHHIFHSTSLVVTVEFTEDDLSQEENSLDGLNALEDDLERILDKQAIFVGHETLINVHRRVMFFHVIDSPELRQTMAGWLAANNTWDMKAEYDYDPQWEILRRWR